MANADIAVVDSSGWIEWLTDGANAAAFAPALDGGNAVIVPTIVLYETTRWMLAKANVRQAQFAAAIMRRHGLVDLDADLALAAALLSTKHRLPMADSIILATARRLDALVWTQDSDFHGIDGVNYFPKPRRP